MGGFPVEGAMPRPRLTVELILGWADAHHDRTSFRPHIRSGAVVGVPGQTWAALDIALRLGLRGLPGRDSLRRLLCRLRPNLQENGGPGRGNLVKRARVTELRAQGLSHAEIAARLQVSRQAVSSMLQRTGRG
jgi:hypothetical protein